MKMQFIEFTQYVTKERVLIDVLDISAICESKDYCTIYFKSQPKQILKVSNNYNEIIKRLINI